MTQQLGLPVPLYSGGEWNADASAVNGGAVLRCPRCDHDESFRPYEREGPGGTRIRYRGCKVSGMFQYADGVSRPFQTHMAAHLCIGKMARGARCRCCDDPVGGLPIHLCHRILTVAEDYACPECGTTLGDDYTIPWPVEIIHKPKP